MHIFKITIYAKRDPKTGQFTRDDYTISATNDIIARAIAVGKWRQLFKGYAEKDKPTLQFCTCAYESRLDN